LLERYVGFGPVDAGPDMNTDHLLARIFGAFKAFVAQLHASLIFAARPISAVTLDTSRVLRQFAFHFDMAVDCRHKTPGMKRGTRDSRRHAQISQKGKHLRERAMKFLGDFTQDADWRRVNSNKSV
jgi:hypothetical protein